MTSYVAAFLAKTKLENVRVGNFIPYTFAVGRHGEVKRLWIERKTCHGRPSR
jgi:hypothetical protein